MMKMSEMSAAKTSSVKRVEPHQEAALEHDHQRRDDRQPDADPDAERDVLEAHRVTQLCACGTRKRNIAVRGKTLAFIRTKAELQSSRMSKCNS